ncbi:MAG: RDD family protein [Elusimicrobia bacterium]|nr:RDD family protein [Elusimicrobiota bacterium]
MQDTEPVIEPMEKSYTIAPVSDRLLAFIIDYLPFFIVPAAVIWFITTFLKDVFLSYNTLLGVLAVCQILFFVYAAVFNSGNRLTLGKWLMGLKVVTTDGNDLNIVRGVMRSLGYLIGLVLSFTGFALAYITKDKRALQDYMAGSVVISTREKTEAQSLVVMFMAAIIAGGLVAMMGFYIFKAQPAYQKELVNRARIQVAKLAFLQEIHKQKYGRYTQDIVRLGLISGDAVQFRRDMQANLRRQGFLIGVSGDKYKAAAVAKGMCPKLDACPGGDNYKITAVAKDNLHTKVSVEQ